MHRRVYTCVCVCHLGMPVHVYVCLCVVCVQACVCILVHFPGRPQVTLLHMGMHMCILSINCSPHPSLRFLGCKGFPGACMTGLCTRCQPHPNMQLPLLLSNPRLPNTSLHPSETSTSPTSVYQVRNYSSQGSPPCSGSQHRELLRNGPKASDTPETKDGGGGSPPPFLLGCAESTGGPREQHRDTRPWFMMNMRKLSVCSSLTHLGPFSFLPVKLSVEGKSQ